MEDLIQIGFTHKAHGLNGEIKLNINDAFLDDIKNVTVFFIKRGGTEIPFFPEYLRFGNSLITKFEDIDSRNDAERISSKPLLARKSELKLIENVNPELKHLKYSNLLGYTIIDAGIGALGKIEDIIEYPQQEMAIFTYQQKERMLPLNDNFIEKIDDGEKQIHVLIPDGILDI